MNGDTGGAAADARADWPALLRERLVQVARRRVATDAVEDIVQDAMRIIVERGVVRPGAMAPDGQPGLAWCFQVLRNVIGNHYQKERTRRRRIAAGEGVDAPDAAPGPLVALESADSTRVVLACLEQLGRVDASCAKRLRALAEGQAPGDLARAEAVEEAAFYRRLYRCRLKLRELLAAQGVFA
jgi:DNA-directed RNA polymerase specialized sigma24 family protein